MNYYQYQLTDPRWQKKRLLIFQRDNWACTKCGCTTKQLQVHHLSYHGAPWDAPDDQLQTLCATCHSKITISERLPDIEEMRRELQLAKDRAKDKSLSGQARHAAKMAANVIEKEIQKSFLITIEE